MKTRAFPWVITIVIALLTTSTLLAQEPAPARALDRGKSRIERPVKAIVGVERMPAAAAPTEVQAQVETPAAVEESRPVEPADLRKMVIEGPVKQAIARATADAAAQQAQAKTLIEEEVISAAKDDNPKVAPGVVRWHDDFAAACKAAETSGKPVLLFQMLGQLDQRFT